jgi:hypothetical protein
LKKNDGDEGDEEMESVGKVIFDDEGCYDCNDPDKRKEENAEKEEEEEEEDEEEGKKQRMR